MEPRLSGSRKWTSLPEELVEQVQSLFANHFGSYNTTDKGEFVIEGRIYPRELLLRAGYLPKGELRQNNFEISLEYDAKTQNVLTLIHLAVDCAASLMSDYFNSEELDFPREWKEFSIENTPIFIRYTTVNSQLEAEADKLLGISGAENLVAGDDEDSF